LYYLKERSENEPSDLDYEISELYFEISNRDTKALIEKLAKDGYIDNIIPNFGKFLPDRKYQFITFDGLVFLEDGGYVKKEELQNSYPTLFFFYK
jgi:DNA-binding PadR family transcriptional regulator